jgi:RNA polymerase subunit RPABC4/transcription elongation factor Spt4
MPFCPNCTYEYLEGIEKCPDCGTTLVEELIDHNWVIVFTSDKEYEIQMMKDTLESADIETNVLSQKDSNFPLTGDLAVIKLLVKSEDVSSAQKFIDEIKNTDTEDEE